MKIGRKKNKSIKPKIRYPKSIEEKKIKKNKSEKKAKICK